MEIAEAANKPMPFRGVLEEKKGQSDSRTLSDPAQTRRKADETNSAGRPARNRKLRKDLIVLPLGRECR